MQTQRLRAFLAVAREGGFTAAADAGGVSQPSLSQQVQALERELGVQLLVRSARGVSLTPAGTALLHAAPPALAAVDDAMAAARAAGPAHGGVLRLGYPAAVIPEHPARALLRLRARHPELTVQLAAMAEGTGERLRALRAGLLDAAFVRVEARPDPDLAFLELSREPLLVALPRSWPLPAGAGPVPLGALDGRGLAFYPREQNPAFHEGVLTALREAGATVRVVREAGDWLSLLSAIAEGEAFGFVSPSLAALTAHREVVYRAVTEPAPVAALSLAWRRDYLPAAVEALIEAAAFERRAAPTHPALDDG